jgi:VWFA-related protein
LWLPSISLTGAPRDKTQEQSVPHATFKAEARARVIDVTVRDRKGRPVVGLSRADFRLQEDGVEQEILDVSAITPSAASSSVSSASTLGDSLPAERSQRIGDDRPNSITAIVFERLTPESREPAKIAALRILRGNGSPDDVIGVFLLDLSLRTLQRYTTDLERVRKAVIAGASFATSYYEPNRQGLALPRQFPTDIAETTVDQFGGLTRLHGGFASMDALEAVILGLSRVPGRRSIMYFSDGLALQSDAVRVRFDRLVRIANRFNVSIYPIDAAGLRVHSQDLANGEGLRQGALAGMANDAGGGGGGASGAADYILRTGSTATVFHRLASATGGFVVEDTNNLARGAAAIQADRRYYYLLTYNPKRPEQDGTWRNVTVAVPSRTVIIRARTGYSAEPSRD